MSGVEIHTADGLYIRQIVVPEAGSIVPQHAHRWDHTTMLAKGRIRVWKDGVYDRDYAAPTGIFIKAGVKHAFCTVEPDTVLYCMHNLHGEDVVAVVQEHELTRDEAVALLAEAV